jgi:hypothetical protein
LKVCERCFNNPVPVSESVSSFLPFLLFSRKQTILEEMKNTNNPYFWSTFAQVFVSAACLAFKHPILGADYVAGVILIAVLFLWRARHILTDMDELAMKASLFRPGPGKLKDSPKQFFICQALLAFACGLYGGFWLPLLVLDAVSFLWIYKSAAK